MQLGINLGDTPPTERLVAATGMCTHKVSLTSIDDVDRELVAWLRQAFDAA
jgi:hypothetical protein